MSTIIRKEQNTRKPWTVRWQDGARQKERSFATKAEATRFRTDKDHAMRYGAQDETAELFGAALDKYLLGLAVCPRSAQAYRYAAKHLEPLRARKLSEVATDFNGVRGLLSGLALSGPRVQIVASLVLGTVNEAVSSGGLTRHNLAGIKCRPSEDTRKYEDFAPATMAQIEILANGGTRDGRTLTGAGLCVWLMLGCGLRPEEALGVHREHFRDGGRTLRVQWQASRDGNEIFPLKHRKSTSQWRDVPVPAWLWDKVRELPDGPVQPGNPYQLYGTVARRFGRARELAGLPPQYTMHSLRHQYGSVLLRAGVPPTDVAGWLGHRGLDTLYRSYRSELAGARDEALTVLDKLIA